MAKICRIGYHEEKAQSTDSHRTARTGPQGFGGGGVAIYFQGTLGHW